MESTLDRTITTEALRLKVSGNVHLPSDESYDAARASWNLTLDHRPAIVVQARTEDDVVEAIRFADANDLPIAVHNTGHGAPRVSNGGVLISMGAMNGVRIDREAKTASIQGGAVWADVIPRAVEAGLVPVSGSSPGVGVVGYTLGGGFGILSRKYGLGVDNVLSFRIVTPGGEAQTVYPNEDLYWAVLGGGGSYGVVTEITIRLHPHGSLFAGSVMFDASLSDTIYPTFVEWTKDLPEEVSAAITMLTYPPVPFIPEFLHGRSMLTVSAAVLADATEAERLLAPIRSLPGAEYDAFRPISYTESAQVFNDPVEPLPASGRGVLLKDLDDVAVSTLLRSIGAPAESPNMMIQIRHLGGAMGKPGLYANAVSDRRKAKYLAYFLAVPIGPVTLEAAKAHAEAAFESIEPWVLSRGPLNWLGEGNVEKQDIRSVFDDDGFAKLLAVKQAVDPKNRFRFAGVGVE